MGKYDVNLEMAYSCSHCGYSPSNGACWCDLGCGRDYNEMKSLDRMEEGERQKVILKGLSNLQKQSLAKSLNEIPELGDFCLRCGEKILIKRKVFEKLNLEIEKC